MAHRQYVYVICGTDNPGRIPAYLRSSGHCAECGTPCWWAAESDIDALGVPRVCLDCAYRMLVVDRGGH